MAQRCHEERVYGDIPHGQQTQVDGKDGQRDSAQSRIEKDDAMQGQGLDEGGDNEGEAAIHGRSVELINRDNTAKRGLLTRRWNCGGLGN